MTEEIGVSITTYRRTLSELTSLSEVSLQLARENDETIIHTIIDLHRQLVPGQVLVLRVNLTAYDNTEFESPNRYAEIVHDEPTEFICRLHAVSEEYTRYCGHIIFPELFPNQIEIAIPPDILSEEDLGANTSESRNAVLSGRIKRYMYTTTLRFAYLIINLSGLFQGIDLPLHPSVIEEVRIEESRKPDKPDNYVVFRTVPV